MIPKWLELDLFEGKGIVSWVATTWQDVKPYGLPWSLGDRTFSLSFRTYVKQKRKGEWVRGYICLSSWMSGYKNRWFQNRLGLGRSEYLDIKRAVHFEPHEKSSRGVFEYRWSHALQEEEQVLRFTTAGSPQPAMAGYLEYFTSEKHCFFVSQKNKVTAFSEDRQPWVLWELDESKIPKQWPIPGISNVTWDSPISAFVAKGSKIVVRTLRS